MVYSLWIDIKEEIFDQLSRSETKLCVAVSTLCVQYLACCHLANSSKVCSRPLTHIEGDTQWGVGLISNSDAIASQGLYCIFMAFILICFTPCVCHVFVLSPRCSHHHPYTHYNHHHHYHHHHLLPRCQSRYSIALTHTIYLCVCVWTSLLTAFNLSIYLHLHDMVATIFACIVFLYLWVKIIQFLLFVFLFFLLWQFDRSKN